MQRLWAVIAAPLLCACLQVDPTPRVPTEAPEAAAPVIWEGVAPASLWEVGEERVWEFSQGGRVIGRHWARYEGVRADGLTWSTRSELIPLGEEGEPLRSQGELVLSDAGEFVRSMERSVGAELRVSLSEGRYLYETVTGVSGAPPEELAFQSGDAVMAFMSTAHEELMLGLRDWREGETLEARLVSLSAARADPWEVRVESTEGALLVHTSLGEEIVWREGRIVETRVDDDGLTVRSTQTSWPEWTLGSIESLEYRPAADARFSRQELEVVGRPGEPQLRGELLVPTGAKEDVPGPAVLMLGPALRVDRHGFAGPPPIDLGLHVIGDTLANAGYRVLRWDERGVGRSEDGVLSWQGQLEDAHRALRTLMVQPGVDPDRIVVLGWREGGWRALSLSADRPREVAAVVLLDTPASSVRDQLKDQPDLLHSLEQGEVGRGGLGGPAFADLADWLGSALEVDPVALASAGKSPVWSAQGRLEGLSPTGGPEGAPVWCKKISNRQRACAARQFDELDGNFQRPGESSKGPDPAFLKALLDWLGRELPPT